ncbi:MAG TPA: 8-oxo-dGTP diphosphatase [Roseiflexaceae bacterium]|jgi:8-oxo-dGTP diphosphatase|nr:8-oxo-dGTP diphosphatase [Roseiflexaceae bacterium]
MAVYTPILATLGYVMSPDGQSVLMINRNARVDDQHYGKYNGLGGKLEPDEDVATGIRREIREEAGIEAEELVLRGTISWPGFGKNDEDWFAFVFRIDRWSGTPIMSNHEGTLEWVPLNRFHELNLWDSDRLWLDMVFDRSARMFHGVAPYQKGKLVSWNYTLM